MIRILLLLAVLSANLFAGQSMVIATTHTGTTSTAVLDVSLITGFADLERAIFHVEEVSGVTTCTAALDGQTRGMTTWIREGTCDCAAAAIGGDGCAVQLTAGRTYDKVRGTITVLTGTTPTVRSILKAQTGTP